VVVVVVGGGIKIYSERVYTWSCRIYWTFQDDNDENDEQEIVREAQKKINVNFGASNKWQFGARRASIQKKDGIKTN
jgi:hypothetical protein